MLYNIRIPLLLLLVTCWGMAYGQPDNINNNAFWNDANGRPLKINVDFRVEGSPFYYEEYCQADVYMANGKKYENVRVKLNLVENDLLFKTDKNEEMIVTSAVNKIKFYNYTYQGVFKEEITLISFKPVLNEKGTDIFELLDDGTAKLVKKVDVNFTDNKPYNEATITRTYNRTETLYALMPGNNQELIKVQKNKTGILELFADNYNKIATYIDEGKLKCKTEKDIIQVFQYYNSLKSKK